MKKAELTEFIRHIATIATKELQQSVGNERNRPDVRDDSEGIHGGTDKRETTSETKGVSYSVYD